MAATIVEK